jgi:membrane protease YdiL (CAAX protease family)
MAAWGTFAVVVGVVLALLLALSRLTGQAMAPTAEPADDDDAFSESETVSESDTAESATAGGDTVVEEPAADARAADPDAAEADEPTVPPDATVVETPLSKQRAHLVETEADALSGTALLANVVVSQGGFALLLVVAAVATGVPATALGVTGAALSTGPAAVAVGVGVGVGLYLANRGVESTFRRFDVVYSEDLRELLAPSTPGEWALLLGVALPLVAFFEEFLFRAILVGGMHAGFGVSPWVLVGVSSVLFGAGHSAQGPGGIVATGGLGVVLGATFVVTDSLLAVVVAHYLVNALEFLVHET